MIIQRVTLASLILTLIQLANMAPQTKVIKATKGGKPGNNLHMFFGPTGSQPKVIAKATTSSQPSNLASQKSQTALTNDNSKATAVASKKSHDVMFIDDSDDEPLVPSKKPTPAKPKTKKVTAILSSEEEDNKIPSTPSPKKETTLKRKKSTAIISSDEDEPQGSSPPKKKAALASSKSSTAKPRASTSKTKPAKREDDEDFDMESPAESEGDDDGFVVDDDEDVKPKKRQHAAKKAPAASSSKSDKRKEATASSSKEKVEDSKSRAKEAAKKFNWAAKKAAQLAGPVAHGSKEVPDGASDALAGLSLVFTGELSSFSRDEAIELGKRFGGRVVLQPSSKTDYVVLGDNAGPSKLAAIKKHGIKTLTEDEFLDLIGTRKGLGNGKVDEKTKKKMEKEQEDIKKAAKEMEKREQKEQKEHSAAHDGKAVDPSTQLWTTRYAPHNLKEICGNKGQVEKLQQWLHDWPTSLKSGFKKPGKSGMNVFRAVLITGSPGIGKTTSAHLCAKLEGFTPIEMNASDSRSKKLVESGMNVNNTSLDGYIMGGHETNSLGVTITDKSCLIMDEVDGMSAGDRGGVGALNALIRKTKIPIICIANDRGAQKLKPLIATTYSLPFHKPPAQAIRSRILSIAFKEKMKIPANVVDQLINGAQSDIRQVLNMLSTWKLSNDAMDFDEGKDLARMNQKHSIMTPFDITSKLLGPYVYSSTSRETLGDKMEYYFQDHSFVPLFIQENYLKTTPARVRNLDGPEKILKELQLMDRAASSISDGDLVDALIHGPEQHWGLMPLHAICSTVTPTSLLYGGGISYGGPNAMSFPQWLGQNSKQNKLARQLGDVQIRMRLKVSGDKTEIRQSYIPALFPHIIQPLMDVGASAVPEVIEQMDEYYISKEDWDTIVELGVGEKKDDAVLKKISAATKTTLTRKYNSTEHPIPFHKAEDLGKLAKKIAGEPAPDLEEAYVEDVIEEASDDEAKSKDLDDVTKDSLIKATKKRTRAAKK
ncbi:replication factor RFC1 C terminal domain-containing protein [Flammula alnicola]|nr:replication factor RFC1 C terminal domain-containing protein [Flammula alnicola]